MAFGKAGDGIYMAFFQNPDELARFELITYPFNQPGCMKIKMDLPEPQFFHVICPLINHIYLIIKSKFEIFVNYIEFIGDEILVLCFLTLSL